MVDASKNFNYSHGNPREENPGLPRGKFGRLRMVPRPPTELETRSILRLIIDEGDLKKFAQWIVDNWPRDPNVSKTEYWQFLYDECRFEHISVMEAMLGVYSEHPTYPESDEEFLKVGTEECWTLARDVLYEILLWCDLSRKFFEALFRGMNMKTLGPRKRRLLDMMGELQFFNKRSYRHMFTPLLTDEVYRYVLVIASKLKPNQAGLELNKWCSFSAHHFHTFPEGFNIAQLEPHIIGMINSNGDNTGELLQYFLSHSPTLPELFDVCAIILRNKKEEHFKILYDDLQHRDIIMIIVNHYYKTVDRNSKMIHRVFLSGRISIPRAAGWDVLTEFDLAIMNRDLPRLKEVCEAYNFRGSRRFAYTFDLPPILALLESDDPHTHSRRIYHQIIDILVAAGYDLNTKVIVHKNPGRAREFQFRDVCQFEKISVLSWILWQAKANSTPSSQQARMANSQLLIDDLLARGDCFDESELAVLFGSRGDTKNYIARYFPGLKDFFEH